MGLDAAAGGNFLFPIDLCATDPVASMVLAAAGWILFFPIDSCGADPGPAMVLAAAD